MEGLWGFNAKVLVLDTFLKADGLFPWEKTRTDVSYHYHLKC
ncbi:hypothetical protein Murru_2227 [Allomuricauda ruestringensis DSM 13258]|uniref:Uncharacterized protein n=1 Tax=Allomuricauda ruestringensis (strain DSM 13258 / CIP 107369 / LMG 19739 / B1) TaxID=886377 RepID=G2PMV4_ALLRU|nr:hypothetical protein Murru_2227 [Allomuricauda ruestringensis DSM 13258]